jgi:hypothetical protein
MRRRLYSCLLAGLAIAGVALWSQTAQPRTAADQIDFVSLHTEAASALHNLQMSQERRMASVQMAVSALP